MEEPQNQENETPNQRQARLRRERRQAKIATGGGDRLNKIIGIQGRQVSDTDEIDSAKGANSKEYSKRLKSMLMSTQLPPRRLKPQLHFPRSKFPSRNRKLRL
jgi:hypothetical protein